MRQRFSLLALVVAQVFTVAIHAQVETTDLVDGDVTFTIHEPRRPIVISNGQLPLGVQKPEWMNAYLALHAPHLFEGSYEDWISVLPEDVMAAQEWTDRESFEMVRDFPESNPAYYDYIEIRFWTTVTNGESTFAVVQSWVNHETLGQTSLPMNFKQSSTGDWRIIPYDSNDWLSWLIGSDPEGLKGRLQAIVDGRVREIEEYDFTAGDDANYGPPRVVRHSESSTASDDRTSPASVPPKLGEEITDEVDSPPGNLAVDDSDD